MGVPPSYPFVLTQYYPFARSKYIPAQTTFRQLPDNLNYIYIHMNFIIIIRKRRLSFAGALGLFSLKNIHGK
jgi:hypothetical protein